MDTSERDPASLEALRSRPVPAWYGDAKLGIFIHWGLASVPGWAPRDAGIAELLHTRFRDLVRCSPYAEWYENAIKLPGSPAARHHREVYGDRPYAEFRREFEAGLDAWQPEHWAERFAAAGARYVVMVTKHHDGYCLWPSEIPNPVRPGWHAPRDCVGELAAAVRARGMRFGVYYSGGLDWSFAPAPVATAAAMMGSTPRGAYPAYAEAQVRELIERIRPDVLWNDIAWPAPLPGLLRLFADYYAAVPEGVVNDRWQTEGRIGRLLRVRALQPLFDALAALLFARPGANLTPARPPHFDTRTPEYGVFADAREEHWECVRGMDKSFGYNRNSREEDFISRDELIESLVDIVAKNGNLLLNVGPRGVDGSIPEIQLERLAWLGDWLGRNGEAIYGTRSWRRAAGETAEGARVRFTTRPGSLYALVLGARGGASLTLRDVPARPAEAVELLDGGALASHRAGADLRVELPASLPAQPAHVLRIPQ